MPTNIITLKIIKFKQFKKQLKIPAATYLQSEVKAISKIINIFKPHQVNFTSNKY